MNIEYLAIVINPVTDTDKGLDGKQITFENGVWNLSKGLFPRDIRLIARLEELINEYNKGK